MLALGSFIAGVGLLVTGLLALLFRHPNAPRWTRPEIVAMLVCVPVTATTGLGLGYVAYGMSRLLKGTGDPRELLVLAGVVIVLAVLWRVLRIGERLRGYAVDAGGLSPSLSVVAGSTLATDEEPPHPEPRAPSSRTAA
jgi:hypothetical protein